MFDYDTLFLSSQSQTLNTLTLNIGIVVHLIKATFKISLHDSMVLHFKGAGAGDEPGARAGREVVTQVQ